MYTIPPNVGEEKTYLKNGFPYAISCHTQKHIGYAIAAGAHIHDYIEFLYCLEGCFKAYLNGVEYVFEKGDLLLINSREIHHIFYNSQELNRYIVIKAHPKLLYSQTQAVFETKFVLPFTLGHPGMQRLFKKSEIENTALPGIVQQIYQESVDCGYAYELAVRSSVCSLFVWILRYWDSKNVDLHYEVNDGLLRSFAEVLDYISNNFRENITAFDLAEKTNLSYSYFSRMFKRMTGQNFSEYLNHIRISEAEKLLVTTDMTVTQVAMETGFCDTCYFISKFKAAKGITPKQFKKTNIFTSKQST